MSVQTKAAWIGFAGVVIAAFIDVSNNNDNSLDSVGAGTVGIIIQGGRNGIIGLSGKEVAAIVEVATKDLRDENTSLQEDKKQLTEAVEALSREDASQYNIKGALNQLAQGNNELV